LLLPKICDSRHAPMLTMHKSATRRYSRKMSESIGCGYTIKDYSASPAQLVNLEKATSKVEHDYVTIGAQIIIEPIEMRFQYPNAQRTYAIIYFYRSG